MAFRVTHEPELRPAEREPPGRSRLRLVLIYLSFGVGWIVLTDVLLARFGDISRVPGAISVLKGWLFIVATAALLHLLLRQHDRSLGRVENRLRATVENMTDAMVLVDANGSVAQINRAGVELFGGPQGSADTPRMLSLLPFEPDVDVIKRALGGETIRGAEITLRTPDGQERRLAITAAPVPDPKGAMAVVVARDVSEVRRLERMRDDFLATAAHELKTPIAIIKAHVQLLARKAHADTNDAASFAAMDRQCTRITRVVQDLLAVARLGVEALELRREQFDLGELAAEAGAHIRELGGGAAAGELVVQRDAATPVEADRERIGQVVLNLLDNAVKFSPESLPIEVHVGIRHGEARLSVRDYGVGIPEEKQPRIFERFYRAHQGAAVDRGGFGLGLHVSQQIVERLGGHLWFESGLGQGSTFHLSLPLVDGGADVAREVRTGRG